MIFIKDIIIFLKDKSYRSLTISTIIILLTGTITYHIIEGWRWIDAFYFSVITLTSVGYGDFSPQTDFGKIFTTIYILTGIGVILGFINVISQHRISNIERLQKKRISKK